MRALSSFVLSSILIAGCGRSDSTSNPNSDPGLKTQDIDGSQWLVTRKTCGSRAISHQGEERLQFGNSVFAYIYRVSEDPNKICNQALVSNRVVQKTNRNGSKYLEQSTLIGKQKRTVCRDKTGTVLSDEVVPFSGKDWTINFAIDGDSGKADIEGSQDCLDESLHLELNRKK